VSEGAEAYAAAVVAFEQRPEGGGAGDRCGACPSCAGAVTQVEQMAGPGRQRDRGGVSGSQATSSMRAVMPSMTATDAMPMSSDSAAWVCQPRRSRGAIARASAAGSTSVTMRSDTGGAS
jgi:hypothetical protein